MEQRHRSPVFTPAETHLVVNLIENYKNIIMSKCLNSATNVAKEKAWLKISKQFNKANISDYSRTPESLKAKWENLKRLYSKMYEQERNSLDPNNVFYNVHSIIETCKGMENVDALQQVSDDSDEDSQLDSAINSMNSNCYPKSSGYIARRKKIKARSMNFSLLECQLLISLVKREKDTVFSKEPYKRLRAWRRIAEAFNKRFPESRRTIRILRTKYQNMKSVVRKLNSPTDIPTMNVKIIKQEPDDSQNDLSDYSEIQDVSTNDDVNASPDPLKSVLTVLDNCNSDSGIGYGSDTFHGVQDKEIISMQKQLINSQLENTKLERKRIQDAIEADVEERRVNTLINAMKLRTARLQMAAAESELPATHPALSYTEREEVITTLH